MEKEFIPYAEALALKELGFDEPCFAAIDQTDFVHIKGTKKQPRGSMMHESIDCPTFSHAFRWFREIHKFGCYIMELENGEYDYGTIIRTIGDRDYENKPFRTYEEAELACLIKLIEIAKEK